MARIVRRAMRAVLICGNERVPNRRATLGEARRCDAMSHGAALQIVEIAGARR